MYEINKRNSNTFKNDMLQSVVLLFFNILSVLHK